MSYFERIMAGFLRDGNKVTVDDAVAGGNFPVIDKEVQDLLQQILSQLKLQTLYLSEIVGEDLNEGE